MFRRSLFFSTFLAFALSLCTTASALDYGAVTAVRDRTTPTQMILTVELKNVNATDNTSLGITALQPEASAVQQAIANYLDICIVATGATQTTCGETDLKVKYGIGRLPVAQTGLYISLSQLATFTNNGTIVVNDVNDPNIHKYSVSMLIKDTAAEIPVGSKVLIRLFPDKASNNGNKDFATDIKLGSGVINAVPTTGVFATPKSLTATWTNPATFTFEDTSTGASNGVIGLLIPHISDSNQLSFPVKTYAVDPIATPAVAATCTIVPLGLDTDSPTCTVTCDAPKTTFDPTAFAPGTQTTTVDASKSSLGFANLTLADAPYALILQYLPEGTAYSCMIGSPSDAATLVQLGGGPAPKAGDPACFIATAAYGSALDPHIDVLRWFRDRYLLKTQLGKAFVRSYYRHSPPIADWIAGHGWARALTRAALWAPVLFLEVFRDHFGILIAGFLILSTLILMRRRTA